MKTLLAGILLVLVAFLGYVSTREGHFRYERSGVIQAPPEKIYPIISDFKKGITWNPYDQKDPAMKRTFSGHDAQVGSVLEFEGNSETGAGKLEITQLVPNRSVDIRLIMTKPMNADNKVHYELTPEGTGTRFSWSMEGDCGFMGKLVSVFIDCEKMVAGDFDKGIANLKKAVEAAK